MPYYAPMGLVRLIASLLSYGIVCVVGCAIPIREPMACTGGKYYDIVCDGVPLHLLEMAEAI